ncbi:ISLre2 family transposase [Acetivibrio saccincola]|jgi:hypothetical protein|uniref:ISLre2 family transposase n=1 Tax=Acetivibrio saccincola TaxID=1677857 RepID=A0A2K9E1U0_9FIRM|nr:ISLre2 family transposase [Acetivibrio saccincola]AUG56348.1 hypothetical protein HVS_01935 [Acetivibrio saccincola]AUG56352.1 hypothetical protein HVS_01955 [Acetivibrio saccincola]
MYNLSVNGNGVNFKDLEKKIYKYACEQACKMMTEILTNLDKMLLEKRDKKVFRFKVFKHTCIKTIMGPVEIDRRVYEYVDENGKKSYRYLLDEYLEMETIGHMSANLVEKMVENATNVSMRKAAQNIKEMTNQDVSHMAVWNIVQELGQRIEKHEDEKIKQYEDCKLNGQKEVKVLFEEADGVWLCMQGKDKPKKGRKKELKLSVTYEGWVRRSGKKEAYLLKNKRVCAGFTDSRKFKKLRDTKIAEEYNVDEIETKIVNGDGASWIKEGLGEEGVYYQLDPFHKSQAVLRNVPDKKEAVKLIKQLHEGEEEKALERIKELMYECGGEELPVKKLKTLEGYLTANKEGLRPYHLREDIKMPEAPEGLLYRHLGTMEHNICDVLAQRMKGRKMSWSIKGANNLSKILAEKFSGSLYTTIDKLLYGVIPEQKFEEIVDAIKRVASKVPSKLKKQKTYKIHEATRPFEGCAVTEGRKAIRNIFNDRCATELIYR